MHVDWLRVVVILPLLAIGAVFTVALLALLGYVAPLVFGWLLSFAGDNPWVLALVVLALVVLVAKMASRDNPSW